MGVIAETGPLEGNGWTVVSGMTSDNAIETLSFTSAAARCVIDRVHLRGARTSSPRKAGSDIQCQYAAHIRNQQSPLWVFCLKSQGSGNLFRHPGQLQVRIRSLICLLSRVDV